MRYWKLGALVATVVAMAASATLVGQDTSEYATALRKGDAALRARQYEQAVDAFNQANALKAKQSADALYGLCKAFHGLKAYKSAAEACASGLKFAGDNERLAASLHNQRGAALYSMVDKPTDKELAAAQMEFRAAMAMTDAVPLAGYNLGMALLRENKDPEGQKELQAFVDRGLLLPEVESAKKMIANPRRARETFAPDFSFTTLAGEFVSSKDFEGKTVFVDFWGTWCPPCRAATGDLMKIYKKYSTDPNFVMIGVSSDKPSDERIWKEYIADNKMTWHQMLDAPVRKIHNAFGIRVFPTYFVIDGDGVVRGTKEGYSIVERLGDLENMIKKSLARGK